MTKECSQCVKEMRSSYYKTGQDIHEKVLIDNLISLCSGTTLSFMPFRSNHREMCMATANLVSSAHDFTYLCVIAGLCEDGASPENRAFSENYHENKLATCDELACAQKVSESARMCSGNGTPQRCKHAFGEAAKLCIPCFFGRLLADEGKGSPTM